MKSSPFVWEGNIEREGAEKSTWRDTAAGGLSEVDWVH